MYESGKSNKHAASKSRASITTRGVDLERRKWKGKQRCVLQNTFCSLSQKQCKTQSLHFWTEEYMKGKIETICQICQIPKPFFEQKTDCVLLNAQLK